MHQNAGNYLRPLIAPLVGVAVSGLVTWLAANGIEVDAASRDGMVAALTTIALGVYTVVSRLVARTTNPANVAKPGTPDQTRPTAPAVAPRGVPTGSVPASPTTPDGVELLARAIGRVIEEQRDAARQAVVGALVRETMAAPPQPRASEADTVAVAPPAHASPYAEPPDAEPNPNPDGDGLL